MIPVGNRPSSFYLGCEYNLATKTPKVRPDNEVHYESKDLCTHGVIVGMTGSGKTGLSLALLEEAALDSIPCVLIDPKGDLTNLLLQFPGLDPADFARWISPDEAAQKGLSVEAYAQQIAQRWEEGLHACGYSRERLVELRSKTDYRIYTPGSEAGLPLSILRQFAAPRGNILREDLNQKIDATASALLGLTGISSDPVQSREHILIANLLAHAWNAGRDLDLPQLIQQIQEPPMEKVGVLDVEAFYKEKDRRKLAISLNNILASPSFATWLTGEPLDIGHLLSGSPPGKTRQLIFYIAHLDDSQRMFFVSLLLAEMLSWTRKQTGTTNLRAMLYFDEVYGYLPPHPGNPPSKKPLMTLFKQARAFGVGVLLATQNPVDLDYKALSNAGTWFVGKLQTERDKARLLDGLEGAAAERGSAANRADLEKTISALGNRVFLLHNVHRGGDPKVFQTRWAMSFLRGPMSREEVARMMEPVKQGREPVAVAPPPPIPTAMPVAALPVAIPVAPEPSGSQEPKGRADLRSVPANDGPEVRPTSKPLPALLASVAQFYLAPSGAGSTTYQAYVLGHAETVVKDKKMGRQFKRTTCLMAPAATSIDWSSAQPLTGDLETSGRAEIAFGAIPAGLDSIATFKDLEKAFLAHVAALKVKVPRNAALNMLSEPAEDREAFLNRCYAVAWREFEKKIAADREMYTGEFGRYGAALPEPSLLDPALSLVERFAALTQAFAALRAMPSGPLDAKKQKQLQELEADWRNALMTALQNEQRNAENIDDLALAPTVKDVRIVQFGLLWVPA